MRATLIHWSALAVLICGAPLFGWQIYRLWRDTPRLPAAPGATHGQFAGRGPALRLLAIGESTVAGVGASRQDRALGAATARALAAATGRRVRWESRGTNGMTARGAAAELVPEASAETSVAVVALGVNDVLGLTSPARWRRDLKRLIDAVRAAPGRPRIVLAGVPPMNRFPGVRWPLNRVLGWRARALDLVAAELIERADAHAPLSIDDDASLFAGDGFHPSDRGYALWGAQLAAYVVDPDWLQWSP